MKKTIAILSSENVCFKYNLKQFVAAFRGKHSKFLYQIYSSIIQHLKTAYAMEICGLKKIIQQFLIVESVIATAISFAIMQLQLILLESLGNV